MSEPIANPKETLDRLAELERELETVRDELDHGQRLMTLGTMTAGVAHEVNNVLTPALAYAQMAQSRPEDDALKLKAVDKAVEGIGSAARILDAILDFSRGTADDVTSDVSAVLRAAMECLGRDLERSGIHVRNEVPRDASVSVPTLALQQVFMNLLLNSVKALRSEGGTITVSLAEDADHVTVSFRDDGPGVPPEIAAAVFDPFVTTRQTQGGHGLGLTMCRRVVEGAGGSICLCPPEAGEGARFEIRLPRAS
ncbi:MAG: HAMP domain-containing histidine kinase [Phycisphaerales bacterium]|nr:HAMP domain-containing histidine kinase [Phycisphaerae bacterium]NNF42590.1 HAMP domain-containing histidine kinase [Phycisphaerales bacterium]NNM25754.1 HAMP domain-containing histidine kinase [Phycisphaerales bacterium]